MRCEANGGEQSLSLLFFQLSVPHQLRQQRDTFTRATGGQRVQQRLPVGAVSPASHHSSAISAIDAWNSLKKRLGLDSNIYLVSTVLQLRQDQFKPLTSLFMLNKKGRV